ncbi:hypothetical protein G6F60_014225 [Rhizopus arrhizus]|nr:hypothetical protein G6F60_014225 [Rhizopus arrhizus]
MNCSALSTMSFFSSCHCAGTGTANRRGWRSTGRSRVAPAGRGRRGPGVPPAVRQESTKSGTSSSPQGQSSKLDSTGREPSASHRSWPALRVVRDRTRKYRYGRRGNWTRCSPRCPDARASHATHPAAPDGPARRRCSAPARSPATGPPPPRRSAPCRSPIHCPGRAA